MAERVTETYVTFGIEDAFAWVRVKSWLYDPVNRQVGWEQGEVGVGDGGLYSSLPASSLFKNVRTD